EELPSPSSTSINPSLKPLPCKTTIEVNIPSISKEEKEKYKAYNNTIDYNYSILPKEPTTLKQALESPKKEQWKEAIFKEISTIIKRGTFQAKLVTVLKSTSRVPLTVK
ncbi:hypothetical protein LZ30DRAFT_816103, partial [Colletotrichum cereale]